MTVTEQLVRVFLVDKQLRGLQSRLGGAEKFLKEQSTQLQDLAGKQASLETQQKQFVAKIKDGEGEMARLDARITALRTQMDNAQTNKEYQALLTEVNTHKVDREKIEATTLELMAKLEEVRKQLTQIEGLTQERERVKQVAADDRSKKQSEIQERLDELKAERARLAADVPQDVMLILDRLILQRGDDAMAPVEVQDAKRHEFNCGACMMSLPVDVVFALMTSGRMTKCSSCGCLLHVDEESVRVITPPAKKTKKVELE